MNEPLAEYRRSERVNLGPYRLPLRGVEDGKTLWLEAPNTFVAEWISQHLPLIEQVLRPPTALPLRGLHWLTAVAIIACCKKSC